MNCPEILLSPLVRKCQGCVVNVSTGVLIINMSFVVSISRVLRAKGIISFDLQKGIEPLDKNIEYSL